ncbi:MAG: FtsQ-type POTRA domain-containing protein [Desulfobacteraceae bacterium]|nr:FtsQ-type POTRA domain-containing protein [Desulfobacteraceae bacterium]
MRSTKKRIRQNKLKSNVRQRRLRLRRRTVFCLAGLGVLAAMWALSVVLVFSYDVFTHTAYFQTRRITIQGNQRLTQSQLLKQAGVREGNNIFSTNLTLTRNKLIAHPWIKSAMVRREIPDTIHIRIQEHSPVAAADIGDLFLINTSGDLFKRATPEEIKGLPLVTGVAASDFLHRHQQKKSERLINAVMDILDHGCRPGAVIPSAKVERIHADKDLGLTLYTDVRHQFLKLGFGDYKQKFSKIRRLMNIMDKDRYAMDFQSIDITDENRIVVKPATGSSAKS